MHERNLNLADDDASNRHSVGPFYSIFDKLCGVYSRLHTVVMIATSYPRFQGDSVGSFMEPIAQGIAARGHEVHVVAPWHPKWNRPKVDRGVHFHLFRYAPIASL